MANKNYPINKEFEVDIKLKVKLNSFSDYFHLTEEQLNEGVENFKKEISDHLKSELIGSYFDNPIDNVDFVNYEVL